MPPMRSSGSTATAVRMMPMPPSQLSSARHSRSAGGAWSSPVITVAPVVVRPETDSNRPSTGDRCIAPRQKGIDAAAPPRVQPRLVARKASRLCQRLCAPDRAASTSAAPTNPDSAMAGRNAAHSAPSTARSTTIGTTIVAARISRT